MITPSLLLINDPLLITKKSNLEITRTEFRKTTNFPRLNKQRVKGTKYNSVVFFFVLCFNAMCWYVDPCIRQLKTCFLQEHEEFIRFIACIDADL